MKIIRRDNDHVLMDSESRPGKICHTLEKIDAQWRCSCEWRNEGGNMTCKHEKYLQEEDRRRIRNDSERFLSGNTGPEFEELTDEEQDMITQGALRGPEVD